MQGYLFLCFYGVFVFLFIYTYIYTPSNQHFKAFPVSKIICPLQVEQAETSVALQELRTG